MVLQQRRDARRTFRHVNCQPHLQACKSIQLVNDEMVSYDQRKDYFYTEATKRSSNTGMGELDYKISFGCQERSTFQIWTLSLNVQWIHLVLGLVNPPHSSADTKTIFFLNNKQKKKIPKFSNVKCCPNTSSHTRTLAKWNGVKLAKCWWTSETQHYESDIWCQLLFIHNTIYLYLKNNKQSRKLSATLGTCLL